MHLEIIKNILVKKNLRLGQLNKIQRNLILLSSVCYLHHEQKYDEKWFNKQLEDFCELVSQTFILDRSELRRTLVDEGYIARTNDCKDYWLNKLSQENEELRANLMKCNLKNKIELFYETIAKEKKQKKEIWLKGKTGI